MRKTTISTIMLAVIIIIGFIQLMSRNLPINDWHWTAFFIFTAIIIIPTMFRLFKKNKQYK
ncbi:hypothetical protein [Apilactobacillus quenuiae]|uniref:hypothetical protein n=1 Tax=Apilactobacillus quenuiae TaxID=2008377 RepID=UPI000D01F3E8|nr:hypothetical protein [Apilactobacillus quenuiae]